METELRRKQISLVTLGTGTILFGGWSVLRGLLYFWQGPTIDFGDYTDPRMALTVKIVFFLIVALLMLADSGLRIYIGRAARAEGMRGKTSRLYLVLAAVLLATSLSGDVYSLYALFAGKLADQSRLELLVSLLVDLTSSILLAELIVTARRIRKLRALSEG